MSEGQRQQGGVLSVGQLIDGQYEVTGALGRGGFGVVYEGIQRPIGRAVAIKVLARATSLDRERFLREARVAALIDHPGVVTVHGYGALDDGRPYLVMERLQGHNLAQELAGSGAMAPQRALPLFSQCLEALAEAHKKGIVHKDLKPSNLFLAYPNQPRERLVLLDFGIARQIQAEPGSPEPALRLTATGDFIGTPQYMPMEYYESQTVTPALDVYQMGLILVEALTGQAVIQGHSPYQCMYLVGRERLPLPEAIADHPHLGPIIGRALARHHADRFADAGAFLAALSGVSGRLSSLDTAALGAVAMPLLQGSPPPRPSQRRWHYDGPAEVAQVSREQLLECVLMAPEAEHMVWAEGFEDWRHWTQVPYLKRFIGQHLEGRAVAAEASWGSEGQGDLEAQAKWFSRRAEEGDVEAMFQLANVTFEGQGVARDDAAAAALYRKAALAGHSAAQYALGWMHQQGRGVVRDVHSAVVWFRRAASAGHVWAQHNLGAAFLGGEGVVQDDGQARVWYQAAAEQGLAAAQYSLGWLYQQGRGVEADDAQAMAWFVRAAQAGHADALYSMGWHAFVGRGTARDLVVAQHWFERGAEAGHKWSRNDLAWILATSPDDAQRDGARAAALATALDEEHPDDPVLMDTLAAALAELGDFEAAVATQERAIALWTPVSEGVDGELEAYRERLEAYRAGAAWRARPEASSKAADALPASIPQAESSD